MEKNVPNHQLAMVDICNELVNGVYKPTNIAGGGGHIVYLLYNGVIEDWDGLSNRRVIKCYEPGRCQAGLHCHDASCCPYKVVCPSEQFIAELMQMKLSVLTNWMVDILN